MDGRVGDDSTCRKEGISLGVGGTILDVVRTNEDSNPGVRMVRFVGFRRAVFRGHLRGDVGAEKGCGDPMLGDVDGRVAITGTMVKESCLTLRGLLPGETGRGKLESGVDRTALPIDEFIIALKGERGSRVLGDSGDELGDGSVAEGESKLEMVVVGDESAELE